MTKATVIYHSADYDGIFCREIAKHFLGTVDVQYIGWNFGEPKIPMPTEGSVYIMDLPPECLTDTETGYGRLVWIDHHKTSIEKWDPKLNGYRIDGVAACRLAWQWFKHHVPDLYGGIGGINKYWERPTKQEFIDRKVNEPLSVQLVGEYDVWDKRNPWAETFQYSLRAVEPNWETLLLPPEDERGDKYVLELLDKGDACQKYAQHIDASICNNRTWIMVWEGLKFLCVNSARFNSLFFEAKDVPETGHDALMGFCYDGKWWTVSLYHAKHNTSLDLSVIAKKYGGGGHRGACGMTLDKLPFDL